MSSVYIAGYFLFFVIFCPICKDEKFKDKKIKNIHIIFALVLIGAFALRCYYTTYGLYHQYDFTCYRTWAEKTVDIGFKNMYNGDFFLDYPPFYLYFLYFTQLIKNAMGIGYGSPRHIFLIKLFPMIADILIAALVFEVGRKKAGDLTGLCLGIAMAFSPAMICNSAFWGQTDSFFMLLLAVSLVLLANDKLYLTAFVYALALLTKPQALLFGPVFLWYVIESKSVKKGAGAIAIGGGTMYLFSLPFAKSLNPLWLLDLYKSTFNGYRYFTINASNIYSVLNLNWKKLDNYVIGDNINGIVIFALLVLTAILWYKRDGKEKIFGCSFVLLARFFGLCTMMHERYSLPLIVIGLLWYAYSHRREILFLTAGVSYGVYENIWEVFNDAFDKTGALYIGLLMTAVSLGAIAINIYMSKGGRKLPLNLRQRYTCGAAIGSVIFTLGGMCGLGTKDTPQTYCQFKNPGDGFVIEYEEEQSIYNLTAYAGEGEYDGSYKIGYDITVTAYDSRDNIINSIGLTNGNVFSWQCEVFPVTAKKIKITSDKADSVLNELIVTGENGAAIQGNITEITGDFGEHSPANVLDETETFPPINLDGYSKYYYSTYFDEIYFLRSGYEFIHSYPMYETTHPHVGKILIGLGMALFGNSPFGARILGCVASGVLIFVVYLLLLALLKDERFALFGRILTALDFMRYTMGRMATVDSFLVLFMTLMYLFMVKYADTQIGDKKEKIYLLLSGLFMGLAAGTKWSALYGVLGLAAVFFITLFAKAKKIENKDLRKSYILKTVAFCFVAFVAVPFLIYYGAFAIGSTEGAGISLFIQTQQNIFRYHSQLVSAHPCASKWYTWLVDKTPVWLAVNYQGPNVSTISVFGNPVLWLGALPALLYTLVKGIKEKDYSARVIILGYCSRLLPWAFISRETFIYHYYPAVVFGLASISYMVKKLYDKHGKKVLIIGGVYVALAALFFVAFFPVISGMTVPMGYLRRAEKITGKFFG